MRLIGSPLFTWDFAVDSVVTLQSVSQGCWQPKRKLLDRLREALRSRHYSRRTAQTYCYWVKWFIFFHIWKPHQHS